jgi:TRAP-type mannitol/chloroaromatic compound transport system substrate-binding protein
MARKKLLVILIVVMGIVGFVQSNVLAADTIKWKAQAFWSAAELPYKTFVEFCERVKVLTNGRLEIKPYAGGTIVPVFETLDALENGVIQAAHTAPAYWTGKEPAFAAICDLSAAWSHPWEVDAWYHYMGGMQLLEELYKPFGVYPVGIMLWGMESMPSKKPMGSVADLKGLKMRTPPGMNSTLFQKLGASVVVMPGGEVYSALDKGVIEAADWGTPSINQRMGFFQVAKYFNYPGFHSLPLGDFVVSAKEWNKLPADIQQILKTATREWSWDTIERVAIADIKAVKEMKAKGITPVAWNEEELAKVRAAAVGVWDDYANKSPMAKKVIDSKKAWLKELGRIQ